jgi:hypothetical protein
MTKTRLSLSINIVEKMSELRFGRPFRYGGLNFNQNFNPQPTQLRDGMISYIFICDLIEYPMMQILSRYFLCRKC